MFLETLFGFQPRGFKDETSGGCGVIYRDVIAAVVRGVHTENGEAGSSSRWNSEDGRVESLAFVDRKRIRRANGHPIISARGTRKLPGSCTLGHARGFSVASVNPAPPTGKVPHTVSDWSMREAIYRLSVIISVVI